MEVILICLSLLIPLLRHLQRLTREVQGRLEDHMMVLHRPALARAPHRHPRGGPLRCPLVVHLANPPTNTLVLATLKTYNPRCGRPFSLTGLIAPKANHVSNGVRVRQRFSTPKKVLSEHAWKCPDAQRLSWPPCMPYELRQNGSLGQLGPQGIQGRRRYPPP